MSTDISSLDLNTVFFDAWTFFSWYCAHSRCIEYNIVSMSLLRHTRIDEFQGLVDEISTGHCWCGFNFASSDWTWILLLISTPSVNNKMVAKIRYAFTIQTLCTPRPARFWWCSKLKAAKTSCAHRYFIPHTPNVHTMDTQLFMAALRFFLVRHGDCSTNLRLTSFPI